MNNQKFDISYQKSEILIKILIIKIKNLVSILINYFNIKELNLFLKIDLKIKNFNF